METVKRMLKRLPFLSDIAAWGRRKNNGAISNGEFRKRMVHRHKTFWSDPNSEEVRNKQMNSSDPLSIWKDVPNWQRKLSNKHNAREFAKMHGCQVPALYWKGRDVRSIDFSSLPSNYVIRPTTGHSSGMVFLMKDGLNLMDKKKYSEKEIREILSEAIEAEPEVELLFEEFLRTEEGEYEIPRDYKFYTFNGQIAAIQLINRLTPKTGYATWYDENWQQTENLSLNYEQGNFESAPKCFTEMLKKAKELSKAYEIFVRVDFYATPQGVVFGEFTPTPAKGWNFTPAAGKLFINYWDNYCKGKI